MYEKTFFGINLQRHQVILLLIGLFIQVNAMIGQDIAEHQWKNRIILIFSPEEDYGKMVEQEKWLAANQSELEDRDLLTYRIYNDHAIKPNSSRLSQQEAMTFREKYNIEANDFAFILIGKDGGVKLKSKEVVTPQGLFVLIDRMPMRRAEMRRKNRR